MLRYGHSRKLLIRPADSCVIGISLPISTVFQHNLELGDEIRVDSHAPYLRIFDPVTPATAAAATPSSSIGIGMGTSGSSMGSVSVVGSGGVIGGGGVSRDNSSGGDSGVSGISTDDSPFA